MKNPENILLGIFILIIVVALAILLPEGIVNALFLLLGTIVGSLIPSLTQSWNAERDRHNQLRLAALDKRLTVHQEAYVWWRKLMRNFSSDEIIQVSQDAQEWWDKNCLYLDSSVRKEFRAACYDAEYCYNLRKQNANPITWGTIEKLVLKTQNLGQLIVKGVELPPISNLEVLSTEMGEKQ